MGDLLTLRLDEKDKKALAFSSMLSEMPISKVITPFINEGTNISLGGILLYHIDRAGTFDRRTFENFTSMMIEPTRSGTYSVPPRGIEEVQRSSPRVIRDFFEIASEMKVVERMNSTFDEVKVTMDTSFITPPFLRTLCYSLGEDYIRSGASLERLDYQLCLELFFGKMLEFFYHHNATGTVRALSSELYMHQTMLRELSIEMTNRYTERSRTRKFEAIEVASVSPKRGRPPVKKKRRSGQNRKVLVEEIEEG
jgi:hypothetical protein